MVPQSPLCYTKQAYPMKVEGRISFHRMLNIGSKGCFFKADYRVRTAFPGT
jgi:hypothetical protein